MTHLQHSLGLSPHPFASSSPLSQIDSISCAASPQELTGAPAWELHEVFGIVHLPGCPRCSDYVNHMADFTSDPSFQHALKLQADVREKSGKAAFYEAERNLSILRLHQQYRSQIELLQSQLATSQSELNRFQEQISLLVSSCGLSVQPHTSPPQFDEQYSPAALRTNSEVHSSPQSLEHEQQDTRKSYALAVTNATETNTFTSLAISPSSNSSFPSTLSQSSAPSTPANQGPEASRKPVWPKSIYQLKRLMDLAQKPENQRELHRIKALCTDAHAKARDEKTDLQRYLLSNWRNPTTTSITPDKLVQPLNNPRLEDPVEKWYEYLSMHPTSWPRGIRSNQDNKPNIFDLHARLAVMRLRPDRDSAERDFASRSLFMSVVIQLFEDESVYGEIMKLYQIPVAPRVDSSPYPAQRIGVSIEKIARHFAGCGITQEFAAQYITPWIKANKDVLIESRERGV